MNSETRKLKPSFSLLNRNVFILVFLKLFFVLLVTKGLGGALILGDSGLYDSYSYAGESLFNRTFFTIAIVWLVNLVTFGGAFIVFPTFMYGLVAYFMHSLMPKLRVPVSVYIVLFFLPVGMVWSSILGKEVLFLVTFFLFAVFRLRVGLSSFVYCAIAVITMLMLRATYAVSLVLMFELFFFGKKSFIFFKNMALYAVLAGLFYAFFIFDYSDFLSEALLAIQPSFQGGNTSFGLDADYAFGAVQMVQAFFNGMVGFSSLEHLREPRIMILAIDALFGCYMLFLFCRRVWVTGSNQFRAVAGVAVLLVCLTQMLYGGFNAGSSSRFRSNWLIPLTIMLTVNRSPKRKVFTPYSQVVVDV